MKNAHLYSAIRYCHETYGYPIDLSCKILHVARSAYHKWVAGACSKRTKQNEEIAKKVEEIYAKDPSKGYRRIHDDLVHDEKLKVNDKRIYRICNILGIKSTIKYCSHSCTRNAQNPQHVAENLLNREFTAEKPNEKWLTDVTEFKWYEGVQVRKIYLSAILDLYDRRIVSFVIGESNNNPLVFKTFKKALKAYPDVKPLFHSDRGYQYTSHTFHNMLKKAEMTQSMSRVGRCIDNGPMEGFWGILKRERYYGRRFTSKTELVKMITNYISYYNNRRVQRNLGVLTPLEKYEMTIAA